MNIVLNVFIVFIVLFGFEGHRPEQSQVNIVLGLVTAFMALSSSGRQTEQSHVKIVLDVTVFLALSGFWRLAEQSLAHVVNLFAAFLIQIFISSLFTYLYISLILFQLKVI